VELIVLGEVLHDVPDGQEDALTDRAWSQSARCRHDEDDEVLVSGLELDVARIEKRPPTSIAATLVDIVQPRTNASRPSSDGSQTQQTEPTSGIQLMPSPWFWLHVGRDEGDVELDGVRRGLHPGVHGVVADVDVDDTGTVDRDIAEVGTFAVDETARGALRT
jgi:hypothetical protein